MPLNKENKKCDHENCTRDASISNSEYFPGKWYCTFHANRATKEGRRKRKYGNRLIQ